MYKVHSKNKVLWIKTDRYRNQGILSVPGIAGYEPILAGTARIGCFYNKKYFFIIPMAN